MIGCLTETTTCVVAKPLVFCKVGVISYIFNNVFSKSCEFQSHPICVRLWHLCIQSVVCRLKKEFCNFDKSEMFFIDFIESQSGES